MVEGGTGSWWEELSLCGKFLCFGICQHVWDCHAFLWQSLIRTVCFHLVFFPECSWCVDLFLLFLLITSTLCF